MNREKLFKVNFIIQAVLTAVSQIINIVKQTKKDPSTGSGQENNGNDSNDSAAES